MGYTDEKDLPLTWNGKTGENVVWKTLLHGGAKNNPDFTSPGWSSPIVWGDRIFLTTAIWPGGLTDKERRASIAEHHVQCFAVADGKPLWDTVIPAGKIVVTNIYHGYAVPTPATDGKLVFALFSSGVLAALDFDGKIVWREELPHQRDTDDGICSSPILYKDTVIVPGIQDMGLRALDKKSGKLKWEQKTKQRNQMATPALIRIQDRLQLIHYAAGIQGLDPATGEQIWTCRAPTSQSSPVYGKGLLYADAGRGGQKGAAIDPTGKGDVSKTHVKWEVRVEGVAGSSAIIVDDHVYRSSGERYIRCWSLADGELAGELKAPGLSPSSSPIATPDGRIYFASSRKSYVIRADPKLEVLATNELGDGEDFTTPAVSGGRIYIKGKSHLWCIGKRARIDSAHRSRQQLLHHPRRLAVGQRHFLAVAAIDEPAVVEAEQVQQRRLVVVVVDHVLHGMVAEVVGGAVDMAGPEAAPCQPVRKAERVVIAADALQTGVVLDDRQPAHFAAPVDHRRIEQTAALEVAHQGGDRLVGHPARVRQGRADAAVVVPELVARANLDEAYAAFDEPAGDQAAGAVFGGGRVVEAIEPAGRFGFAGDVEGGTGRRLHAGGQLVGGDAGFEVVLAGARLQMAAIEAFEVRQVVGLGRATQMDGGSRLRMRGSWERTTVPGKSTAASRSTSCPRRAPACSPDRSGRHKPAGPASRSRGHRSASSRAPAGPPGCDRWPVR